jgi:hypothetical protein
MIAYVVIGGLLVAGGGLGFGLAWGMHYWSRDEVIRRARRRDDRRHRRAVRARDRALRLERRELEYRLARGLPVGQVLVRNAPPIPVRDTIPPPPPR